MNSDNLRDAEWEYEYDETETEDVYFTLDLTTHVPDAVLENDKYEDPQTPAGLNHDNDSTNLSPEAPRSNQLQILDLHKTNPLVKFNEVIYSCYWSSDYGSQLYITKAGTVANPKRPGHKLDIIGLSQARLIAVPTDVQSREKPSSNVAHVSVNDETAPKQTIGSNSEQIVAEQTLRLSSSPSLSEEQIDSEDEFSDGQDYDSAGPSSGSGAPQKALQINRKFLRRAGDREAVSFLQQLSAIKQEKGEMDQVSVFSVRDYEPPRAEEQAAIRDAALEQDGSDLTLPRILGEFGEGGKKRKRRRFTKREMGVPRKDEGEDRAADELHFVDMAVGMPSGRRSRQATARRVGFHDD